MIKQTKGELLKSSPKSSRTKVQSKGKPAQKTRSIEKINPTKTVKSPAKKKGGPLYPVSSQKSIKGKSNTSQKAKSPVNIEAKKSDSTKTPVSKKVNLMKATKTDTSKQLTKPVSVITKKNAKISATPKPAKLFITNPNFIPHLLIEKDEFMAKQQAVEQILVNLFGDYYLNAVNFSKNNIPAAFELNNAKKLIAMLVDKDIRIKKNMLIDSSTLITYLKPVFEKYKIKFPDDFYAKLRLIVVQNMIYDTLPEDSPLHTEFTRVIVNLSLNGIPCKE